MYSPLCGSIISTVKESDAKNRRTKAECFDIINPHTNKSAPVYGRKERNMAWDDVAGKAMGGRRDKYVVIQVVLTEKLLGTGSGTASLTNLQAEINKQAAKGYRLHTISRHLPGPKVFWEEIRSRRQWCLRGSTEETQGIGLTGSRA